MKEHRGHFNCSKQQEKKIKAIKLKQKPESTGNSGEENRHAASPVNVLEKTFSVFVLWLLLFPGNAGFQIQDLAHTRPRLYQSPTPQPTTVKGSTGSANTGRQALLFD